MELRIRPSLSLTMRCTAGKVAEVVEEGQAEVKSNRGNTIHKNASKDDPAVKIERSVSFIPRSRDSLCAPTPCLRAGL